MPDFETHKLTDGTGQNLLVSARMGEEATLALYVWRGLKAEVTNPNAWTPTGLPTSTDVAEIASGTALISGAQDDTGVDYVLGNTDPTLAPDLIIQNGAAASVQL